MGGSKKQGDGYNPEYLKNRNGSSRGSTNKVKRKSMRDATSNFKQSGIHLLDEMPTRTYTVHYSGAVLMPSREMADIDDDLKKLEKDEAKLEEEISILKTKKQEERFEEWKEGKSVRVVRKALKKAKREGLDQPIIIGNEQQQSDDVEVIEKEQRRRRAELNAKHGEAVKYLETGSERSFRFVRLYTTK